MSPSSPPPPPDPAKVASAQTGTNIQSAIANSVLGNVNQVGPTGSTTYDTNGFETITGADGQTYKVPRYTQTTTLSPDQQKLYNQGTELGTGVNDLAIGQVGRLKDTLGNPIDATGLPERANLGTDDFSGERARVEQAMYDRINPQLERDRTALETKLTNQGFQRGTQAWNDALGDYNRQVNDLRLGITERGTGEQQSWLDMALKRANFANANRSGALEERLAIRNQPINEISALRSGGQVSLPNAQPYNYTPMSTPDIAGLTMQNYQMGPLAQYQAQNQYKQALMGGLFGLGGAGVRAAGMMYGAPPTY